MKSVNSLIVLLFLTIISCILTLELVRMDYENDLLRAKVDPTYAIFALDDSFDVGLIEDELDRVHSLGIDYEVRYVSEDPEWFYDMGIDEPSIVWFSYGREGYGIEEIRQQNH